MVQSDILKHSKHIIDVQKNICRTNAYLYHMPFTKAKLVSQEVSLVVVYGRSKCHLLVL